MPARENDSDVKRNVQRAGNACTKPSAVQNCPAPDLSNFSGPQTESQAGWIKSLPCKTSQRRIRDQTEDKIWSSDHQITLLGRTKRPPRKFFPSGPIVPHVRLRGSLVGVLTENLYG